MRISGPTGIIRVGCERDGKSGVGNQGSGLIWVRSIEFCRYSGCMWVVIVWFCIYDTIIYSLIYLNDDVAKAAMVIMMLIMI